MGQVLQLYPVGEKRHPGLQDPPRSAENFFDQPGTGRAPHSPYFQNEGEGGNLRSGGPFGKGRAGRGRRLPRRNDSRFHAGAVEVRIAKIFRNFPRRSGENGKNLFTPRATEAKSLSPDGFPDAGMTQGKPAEVASAFLAVEVRGRMEWGRSFHAGKIMQNIGPL